MNVKKSIRLFFQLLAFAPIIAFVYFNIYVIPENNFGLLKEYTEGWQKKTLEPGFHWLWTGFVPEKWKLVNVDRNPPAINIQFNKGLQFTDYLELSKAYRVQLDLRVQYQVTQKNIFKLLDFLDDDPYKISQFVEKRILNLLELKFLEFYKNDNDIPALQAKFSEFLNSQVAGGFTAIFQNVMADEGMKLTRLQIERIYIPNKEIYLAQINNIDELFDARRKAFINKVMAQAQTDSQRMQYKANQDDAMATSRIIQQNSSILEYIKYKKMNPKAKIIIIDESNKSNSSLGQSVINNHTKIPHNNSNSKDGYLPPIK